PTRRHEVTTQQALLGHVHRLRSARLHGNRADLMKKARGDGRRGRAHNNVKDPVLRGYAMSETATENLDGVLPPTAHKKASSCEGAGDSPTSAPTNALPADTEPRETALPANSAPSALPTLPNSPTPSAHAASQDSP